MKGIQLWCCLAGPGGSAYAFAPLFASAPFNVIGFDERGVGFSEPRLDCPERDELFLDAVEQPAVATVDANREALASCLMRLRSEGIDLTAFDSAASAFDLGVVHRALGFDANVFETRSVAYRRALDRLVESRAADTDCAALGDLAANLEQLSAELAAKPVMVDAARPVSGASIDVLVDGDRLQLLLYSALFNPRVFTQVLSDDAAGPRVFAVVFNTAADCAVWNTEPAPAVENEPVLTPIPRLVLAGAFDPVTPPSDGQLVADRLAGAVSVEAPSADHGVGPNTECTRSLLTAFIDEPADELDLSCVETMAGPVWDN